MKMKIAFALLGLVAMAASPAYADKGRGEGSHDNGKHEGGRGYDRGDDGRRDEWRREHWRDHEEYNYGRGYRAPPPVYYLQPQRPYYPPPGIFIPFR